MLNFFLDLLPVDDDEVSEQHIPVLNIELCVQIKPFGHDLN